MALSSVHDVANPKHASNGNAKTDGCDDVETTDDTDKQFRPNPDAKPFIPNPLTVAAAKWHLYFDENGKNVNGVVPPYYMAPHVDRENVVVDGQPTTNPTKKHIAFHLVSNVLDDEVPEESVKDSMANTLTTNQLTNVYGSIMNEQVDSWQTPSSNFSLPLATDKTSDKRSINNKSIHEIWSPDPSPNGLNNLSPSDEVLNNYQTQQLLDSPTSIIDSPELSFEQVQNELGSPNFTTSGGRIQQYEEVEEDGVEEGGNGHNLNYCYNVPSPVYTPYSYHTNINQRPEGGTDTYQDLMMRKNEMMVSSDASSMVVDQNDYYAPYCMERYPPVTTEHRYQRGTRNTKYEHVQQPVQMSYDLKMSLMEELGICLDECRDQLKHLERDYRKADTSLIQEFRLRRSSGSDGGSLKYPTNSTRVDKLIIDEQKEHQKVESLIGRIERLGFTPMHPNVGVTLDLWLTGIKDLRNVRKNELANLSEIPHLHNSGTKSHLQGDICNLIACVKELTKQTRSARTIVWCALQMLYASIQGASSSGE